MKRSLFAVLALVILMAGCVTARKVRRERVDQDLAVGNRGFVEGQASPPGERKTYREYIQVDVQTPFVLPAEPYHPTQEETTEAEKAAPVEPMAPLPEVSVPTSPSSQPPSSLEEEKVVVNPSSSGPSPISSPPVQGERIGGGTYTVQKGDTLSEISQKVYGKAKYWKNIFETNQPSLSDPNHLKAGMTLVLPEIAVHEAPRTNEK